MKSVKCRSERFVNERNTGEQMTVNYNNWGEPYQEGARFHFKSGKDEVYVDLLDYELKRLHAYLGELIAASR